MVSLSPFVIPPPASVHALIVGIEHYPRLTAGGDALGAVEGAIQVASWLTKDLGVPGEQIHFWMAARDAAREHQRHQVRELGINDPKDFGLSSFRTSLQESNGELGSEYERGNRGSLLVIYWCGHGITMTAATHVPAPGLVLPDSSPENVYVLNLPALQSHLRRGRWGIRFPHQLWIVDTCRQPLTATAKPREEALWQAGELQPVRWLAMHGCKETQYADTDTSGPLFTRELLSQLKGISRDQGEIDLAGVISETSNRVEELSRHSQRPVVMVDSDREDQRHLFLSGVDELSRLIARHVPESQKYLQWLANKVLGPQLQLPQRPGGVKELLNALSEKPDNSGIPRVMEFAWVLAGRHRVRDLRRWLEMRLSSNQIATLQELWRPEEGLLANRLSIILRCDRKLNGNPEFEIHGEWRNAGTEEDRWDLPMEGFKSGLKGCHSPEDAVRKLYDAVTESLHPQPTEIDIECFLTTEDLKRPEAIEDPIALHATVLLRSLDRLKNEKAFKHWRTYAGSIIGQFGTQEHRVQWIEVLDDSIEVRKLESRLVLARNSDTPDRWGWLGFDAATLAGHTPLEYALKAGWPTVLWFRKACPRDDAKALQRFVEKSLAKTALNDLSENIKAMRASAETQNRSAVRSLAVLFDDPNRLPPWIRKLNQP